MLTMTVWEACKPLLLLLAAGIAVLAAVICWRRRRTKEKQGTLPKDVLAEVFRDLEE